MISASAIGEPVANSLEAVGIRIKRRPLGVIADHSDSAPSGDPRLDQQ